LAVPKSIAKSVEKRLRSGIFIITVHTSI
jgi:hypothetical protein